MSKINKKRNKPAECGLYESNGGFCQGLSELVCMKKVCTFFKTHQKHQKDLKTDFLYESYRNGKIDKARYVYLMGEYYKGKKKKIKE